MRLIADEGELHRLVSKIVNLLGWEELMSHILGKIDDSKSAATLMSFLIEARELKMKIKDLASTCSPPSNTGAEDQRFQNITKLLQELESVRRQVLEVLQIGPSSKTTMRSSTDWKSSSKPSMLRPWPGNHRMGGQPRSTSPLVEQQELRVPHSNPCIDHRQRFGSKTPPKPRSIMIKGQSPIKISKSTEPGRNPRTSGIYIKRQVSHQAKSLLSESLDLSVSDRRESHAKIKKDSFSIVQNSLPKGRSDPVLLSSKIVKPPSLLKHPFSYKDTQSPNLPVTPRSSQQFIVTRMKPNHQDKVGSKLEQTSKWVTDTESTFYTKNFLGGKPGADIVIKKRQRKPVRNFEKPHPVVGSLMDIEDPFLMDAFNTEGTKLTLTSASSPAKGPSPEFDALGKHKLSCKESSREQMTYQELQLAKKSLNPSHVSAPNTPTRVKADNEVLKVSEISHPVPQKDDRLWSTDEVAGLSDVKNNKVNQMESLYALGGANTQRTLKSLQNLQVPTFTYHSLDIEASQPAEHQTAALRTVSENSLLQRRKSSQLSRIFSSGNLKVEEIPKETSLTPQEQAATAAESPDTLIPTAPTQEGLENPSQDPKKEKSFPEHLSVQVTFQQPVSAISSQTHLRPSESLKQAVHSLFGAFGDLRPFTPRKRSESEELPDNKFQILPVEPPWCPPPSVEPQPDLISPLSRDRPSRKYSSSSRCSRGRAVLDNWDFVQGGTISEGSSEPVYSDHGGLISECESRPAVPKQELAPSIKELRLNTKFGLNVDKLDKLEHLEEKGFVQFIMRQTPFGPKQMEDLKRKDLIPTSFFVANHEQPSPQPSDKPMSRLIIDQSSESSDSSLGGIDPSTSFVQSVHPSNKESNKQEQKKAKDDAQGSQKSPFIHPVPQGQSVLSPIMEAGSFLEVKQSETEVISVSKHNNSMRKGSMKLVPQLDELHSGTFNRKSLFCLKIPQTQSGRHLAGGSVGRKPAAEGGQPVVAKSSFSQLKKLNSPDKSPQNSLFRFPRLRRGTSNITETLLEQSQLMEDIERDKESEQEEDNQHGEDILFPIDRAEPKTPIRLQIPLRRSNLKIFGSEVFRSSSHSSLNPQQEENT